MSSRTFRTLIAHLNNEKPRTMLTGYGEVKRPGLGLFSPVSVGNTNYTTGMEVHFHPEGDFDPARGMVRYKLTISEDFSLKWVETNYDLDYGDYDGSRFGSKVFDECRKFPETLHQWNLTSWAFHLDSAVKMELTHLERKSNQLAGWAAGAQNSLDKAIATNKTDEIAKRTADRDRLKARSCRFEENTFERRAVLNNLKSTLRDWFWNEGPNEERMKLHETITGILSQEPEQAPEAPVLKN